MAKSKKERDEAIARLKGWLKDGDTLYFIQRHRSTSGLQRTYSVKQIEVREGQILVSDLSSNIWKACGYGWNEKHNGVKVEGYGFSGEQDIAEAVARVCGFEKLNYERL